ncbi:MAG: type II toxin-antitoxin system RelE/ParE family toxin [Pyrinomonadaceae bacterium]
MHHIIWSNPAFRVLETLSDKNAFGIVRQTDMLANFPEMGPTMPVNGRPSRYRRLVYRKAFRIIYRLDDLNEDVLIVMLQNSRQRIPSRRDLDRIGPNTD